MTALRDAAIQWLTPIAAVRAPVEECVDALSAHASDIALRALEELLRARMEQPHVPPSEQAVLYVLIRVLEGRPR